jgi:hypothetical protein
VPGGSSSIQTTRDLLTSSSRGMLPPIGDAEAFDDLVELLGLAFKIVAG